MSGLFSSIEISATGLTLQRKKMDVVAQNIANAETTQTEKGGPYRRKRVMVSAAEEQIPFRNIMAGAKTNLVRTNANHLNGVSRLSRDDMEVSKAEGKEVEDPASSFRMVYDPGHPEADEKGYVKMPDVEIVNEMVDMISASRAYEANTTAILSAKEMAKNALDI
ncbi:MAG: flagellar basal body rod protein FlgC [candidate division Zixibacteria bacterium]|nr:flagellar basal body rod protein FlgC [candidate division Zixibacteria bacterium]